MLLPPKGNLREETPEAEPPPSMPTRRRRDHRAKPRKRQDDDTATAKAKMSHVRLATILGLVAVVALAGLCGWLGFRAYESRKAADERNLFLQVGRQAALNLTTIDFEHADEDVQRVLDSSTGTFYDDFQARAQPFKEVVKQAKSKSVGTIAEAGVESDHTRRSRGAGRGDRQDIQCRCGRTGAARLADADHRAEGRRRSQGGQREVRIVTENKNVSDETVEETAARLEAGAETVDTETATDAEPAEARGKHEASDVTITDEDEAAVASFAKPKRETDWSRIVAFALLPALAFVLAIGAGVLRFMDSGVRDSDAARDKSMQAAKDSTVALLSYKPDTVEQQLTAARDRLIGQFRDQYTDLTNNVVIPGAKAKADLGGGQCSGGGVGVGRSRRGGRPVVRQPDRDRRQRRADRYRLQRAHHAGQGGRALADLEIRAGVTRRHEGAGLD